MSTGLRSRKQSTKQSSFESSDYGSNASEVEDDINAQHVMRKVHDLYTDGPHAITPMANDIGLSILSPRRKVSVMIIGNHSAGKSSFVNWYVDEAIQNTGVAIETQGFTFITHGTKKTLAPIKGESTILLFPYLHELKTRFGAPLIDNLTTCVSTSDANNCEVVDLIDTPGLVDGNISYPFDVNDAIVAMADHVDLIFVFLDPMGQALCSRTMQVVKSLNAKHYDKMRYYLTKADTVVCPKELMKLMVQITQNIKENINNQHGLEIPTIWVPSQATENQVLDPALNQIEKVCDVIEVAIHQKVQDNLSQVEVDCTKILENTQALLHQDAIQVAAKQSREIIASCLWMFAWSIPTCLFIFAAGKLRHSLPPVVQKADTLMMALHSIDEAVPYTLSWYGLVKMIFSSFALFSCLLMLSKFIAVRLRKFETKDQATIKRWKTYEAKIHHIMQRRQELFTDYVHTYTNNSLDV